MRAILQKIKADIVSRPLISALILITIITSSALLTLALATLSNIYGPYDQTFNELDAAHLWLYLDRERVSARDISRIEALPGVAGSTGLRYNIRSQARMNGDRVWVSLRAIPTQPPAVNRLLIQEGRPLAPGQDEVLANEALKDLHQLAVGDLVTLTRSDGKDIDLPVVGLAYDSTWDIYISEQAPYLYLSVKTLRDLYPEKGTWGWSLGLQLTDPEAVDEMVAQVEDVLHGDAVESHVDWREIRESAIFDAQINFVFLSTFSFFAILATILVVASSISSIVLSQFRQIGILKAIGFTRPQILGLYVGQYSILSLVGSPLGALLGVALSPLPLKSVAASLSTTFRPPLEPSLLALAASITMGSVILATGGAALRGARANIIRSIAVGAEAPRKKSPWPVRWTTQLGLPIVLTLGLNDIFAKPLRSFLTGLNLALGVIGIVFGLTITETIGAYRENPALMGIAYDATVTRETSSDQKTRHVLSNAPGVEAFYGERVVEAETPGGRAFQVKAVDGDLPPFPIKIEEGRLPRPNTHEAIAGRGLLNWLGIQVGDEITVYLEDRDSRPITWQIVGKYPEPTNLGRMLMVSLPSIARLVKDPQPSTYRLKLGPGCDRVQLESILEPRSDSDLNLMFVKDAIPDDVVYLQLAIFALSIILIGIALINVLNSSLLAVKEKLKTIGILKTVGMTPEQVVAMVNATAGLLGLIATVLGTPVGLVATNSLLQMWAETYGFGEIAVTLNVLLVILLIPFIILISMVGSVLPGRWAAKVSIVQVLRSE
jgi:putative ABC transport system permease protein